MVTMIKMVHKFLPEITNNGACFCDCSCGESMGVYRDRAAAKAAHTAHKGGESSTVGKVKPMLLFGGPVQGMIDTHAQDCETC